MQAYTGFAQQGDVQVVTAGLSSTTVVEGSYPLCTVTVNLHSGGLATIYSDNGITPLANPFTANANGQFTFYAANNRYDVILSNNAGSGPASPITISDILLNDPAGGAGTVSSVFGRTGTVIAQTGDYAVAQVTGAAPLASPTLTGVPTAPTASFGTTSTQLATTAFVQAAIPSIGVTSFNSRTGAVVPTTGDYTVSQVTGAAPLASPTFTGVPAAPTASFGTNTTQLATTAFVQAALPSTGVITWNTRSGAVVPVSGDYTVAQVTGAAPLASPVLTGTPTAPTPSIGDVSTKIATTQFVNQAGLSPIITVYTILTSAQLLALHGTPITLVAAPGAGFAVYPVAISLGYDYNTTAYTINGDSLILDWNNAGTVFKITFAETGFLDQTASQIASLAITAAHGALTLLNNQPYTIGASGGSNMTLGNGTLTVYLYYVLLTLQ
jgi:hypothetical protein